MAFTEKATDAKLKLVLEDGLTSDGKPRRISKTISKLNPTADNNVVGETSKILATLVKTPVVATKKLLEVEIVEEA